jgi:rhamnulokinase
MEANLTNEGGFAGTIRLLKNVMGLWLLQECRRTWARQGNDLPYDEIARLAEVSPAFGALVDPDHPSFLAPGDLPARIRAYCAQTGQQPPEEPGAMARCVLESLALKYRMVLEDIQAISGHRVELLHVVGGGVRNELLCQFTAGATGLPLLAGPAEATALGNVLAQAHAAGNVSGLQEMRALARVSVTLREYAPEGDWSEPWERFRNLVSSSRDVA